MNFWYIGTSAIDVNCIKMYAPKKCVRIRRLQTKKNISCIGGSAHPGQILHPKFQKFPIGDNPRPRGGPVGRGKRFAPAPTESPAYPDAVTQCPSSFPKFPCVFTADGCGNLQLMRITVV